MRLLMHPYTCWMLAPPLALCQHQPHPWVLNDCICWPFTSRLCYRPFYCATPLSNDTQMMLYPVCAFADPLPIDRAFADPLPIDRAFADPLPIDCATPLSKWYVLHPSPLLTICVSCCQWFYIPGLGRSGTCLIGPQRIPPPPQVWVCVEDAWSTWHTHTLHTHTLHTHTHTHTHTQSTVGR